MTFPKTYTWDETDTPDYINVIRINPATGYDVTFTIESNTVVSLVTSNVAGLVVDFQQALTGVGVTASELVAVINLLRIAAPVLTLRVGGSTGEHVSYRIVFPSGIAVYDVKDTAGNPITFTYDRATNSLRFAYTHASTTDLQLFMSNVIFNITGIMTMVIQVQLLLAVTKQMTGMMKGLGRQI